MLINGIRELAYVVQIDSVEPIPNYDRVEYAHVGGWGIVVKKDQFKVGDKAVYFEIDSKVPATEPFQFLEKYKYRVKTQKMCTRVSQGLLLPLGDLGLENLPVGTGLTEKLGIVYYEAEDNQRKKDVPKVDKYQQMLNRRPKLAKNKFVKKMMKTTLGKKILFALFGKKKDKVDTSFPKQFEFIHKTDEERVENIPNVLNDKRRLIASEKVDGSSSTFIVARKKKKFEFYVLSRNVRQLTPDQKTFHDSNVYWEIANKYDIENKLIQYLKDNPNLDYVCLQGEIVGPGIQKNPLKLTELDFYGFNFIRSDVGRISSLHGKTILGLWGMKWVPIISTDWVNPDTMEEMKAAATGASLVTPSVMREGIVYRDENDSTFSFKNVSIEYLMKH